MIKFKVFLIQIWWLNKDKSLLDLDNRINSTASTSKRIFLNKIISNKQCLSFQNLPSQAFLQIKPCEATDWNKWMDQLKAKGIILLRLWTWTWLLDFLKTHKMTHIIRLTVIHFHRTNTRRYRLWMLRSRGRQINNSWLWASRLAARLQSAIISKHALTVRVASITEIRGANSFS